MDEKEIYQEYLKEKITSLEKIATDRVKAEKDEADKLTAQKAMDDMRSQIASYMHK